MVWYDMLWYGISLIIIVQVLYVNICISKQTTDAQSFSLLCINIPVAGYFCVVKVAGG